VATEQRADRAESYPEEVESGSLSLRRGPRLSSAIRWAKCLLERGHEKRQKTPHTDRVRVSGNGKMVLKKIEGDLENRIPRRSYVESKAGIRRLKVGTCPEKWIRSLPTKWKGVGLSDQKTAVN